MICPHSGTQELCSTLLCEQNVKAHACVRLSCPGVPLHLCSWALEPFILGFNGCRHLWLSPGPAPALCRRTNTSVAGELFWFKISFTPGSRIAQPRGQPGGLSGRVAVHSFPSTPGPSHGTKPSLAFLHPLCRPGLLKTHRGLT